MATSYSAGDKFYIDPAKLLPLARFLPQPKYVVCSLFYFAQFYCIILCSWLKHRSFYLSIYVWTI